MKLIKSPVQRFAVLIVLPLVFCSTYFREPLLQNQNEFDLCGDGELRPYYYPELKYNGGLIAIVSHFKQNYHSVKYLNFQNTSGLVTVRFHVNCMGETGNYEIITLDFDYNYTQLNAEMVNSILCNVKLLNQWIPAKDDNGNLINSHKFLTFKILNGEIYEILPK
jgi:hypothetical protein